MYDGTEQEKYLDGLQAQRDDTRHNERNGGGEPPRIDLRGGIWAIVGVLLPLCRHSLPHTDSYGGCRARSDVLRQAGRSISLGGRGFWCEDRIPGDMAAMDRVDDMVSYGADVRCGIYRIHWYGLRDRCVARLEQALHAHRSARHILDSDVDSYARLELGR